MPEPEFIVALPELVTVIVSLPEPVVIEDVPVPFCTLITLAPLPALIIVALLLFEIVMLSTPEPPVTVTLPLLFTLTVLVPLPPSIVFV